MLSFYYDFLDRYINRSDFQLCEMDTDSSYFAISGEKLIDIIKPEYKETYLSDIYNQCHEIEIDASESWFPRECCKKHCKMDQRTPGLFKLEFSGNCMISLCFKTYMVRGNNNIKLSCKGINKYSVKNPTNIFTEVLKSGKTKSAYNKGFRRR
jgi:hypothetical protein